MVVYIFTRINNKVVIKAVWIKQAKSENETVIVSDGGDEMEPIRAPIKNPRNAGPIVNSSGVVAYKVRDVQV